MKPMPLRPGDICAFRTSPTNSFSKPSTGRYAALKILTSGAAIVYAVLDGIFAEPPDLQQVAQLPVLRDERFGMKHRPAVLSTSPHWDIDLLDFVVLGNTDVAPADLALIPSFPPSGLWSNASSEAEGEWRWRHDREAFRQEVELDAAARGARHRAERARYEKRLKHLTWETLLAETLFVRWSPSPPFPPLDFTETLRASFGDATLELQGMGPKPARKDVRRVLRALVERINRLDDAHGKVIETEEREDLCTALAELAFLARHQVLIEEVRDWRSW